MLTMMDLEAESGNKEYMNQRTVYERFHIWTDFFFLLKKIYFMIL